MTTFDVLHNAREHAHATGNSSALLLVAEADDAYRANDHESAYRRAVKSLKHSVGVFHADYYKAIAYGPSFNNRPATERERAIMCANFPQCHMED
jgi:hypothetical protein